MPEPQKQHIPPEGVSIEMVDRLVRRLANQAPTRYYLDGQCDGSFSMVAIEIWLHESGLSPISLRTLHKEMKAHGFTHQGDIVEPTAPQWRRVRWIAPRVRDETIAPENLATLGELRGAAPNATGGMKSEDFIQKLRNEWGGFQEEEPDGTR